MIGNPFQPYDPAGYLEWNDTVVAYLAESLAAAGRLSADQTRLVHAAVLEACDASDGVADGVVGRPESCGFDPGVLACSGTEDETCLTPAQVTTVRMLDASPLNPKTGRAITGLMPGSELGWTELGWTASARATGLEHFRFLVLRGSGVDGRPLRLRHRYHPGRGGRRRHAQRARSGSVGLHWRRR